MSFSHNLLRWRWGASATITGFVTIYEIVEHRVSLFQTFDIEFFYEILLYGLMFPLAVGRMLGLIAGVQARSDRDHEHDARLRAYNQRLASVRSWPDLCSLLVHLPGSILPATSVSLWVFDPLHDRFDLRAEQPSGMPLRSAAAHLRWNPGWRASGAGPGDGPLGQCRCQGASPPADGMQRYCLPLMHIGFPVALLHIDIDERARVGEEQTELLNELAPNMAMAIEGFVPRNAAALRARLVRLEQRNLSRYLHQTVAQQLALLDLKLSHLTETAASCQTSPQVHRDLEQLHQVVDQTYIQIREFQSSLYGVSPPSLAETIIHQAGASAERSGFSLHCEVTGDPGRLPAWVQAKVQHILSEILGNIEKHSGARNVHVSIMWNPGENRQGDCFNLEVRDDGVGFDVEQAFRTRGHLGLMIIQECIEEIGAQLTLTSAANVGTTIAIRVPFAA